MAGFLGMGMMVEAFWHEGMVECVRERLKSLVRMPGSGCPHAPGIPFRPVAFLIHCPKVFPHLVLLENLLSLYFYLLSYGSPKWTWFDFYSVFLRLRDNSFVITKKQVSVSRDHKLILHCTKHWPGYCRWSVCVRVRVRDWRWGILTSVIVQDHFGINAQHIYSILIRKDLIKI